MDGWTTSADVESTKPDPDLVAAAKEKAGGGDAVMLGDSTWDCIAAGRCDVPTVALLTGGFSEQELREAGAVGVYESIGELIERLDETPLAPDRPSKQDDERTDREAEETFPASDPPANY